MEMRGDWKGWFAAPAPFGKTHFTVTVQGCSGSDGKFSGEGEDRAGPFAINGFIKHPEVVFTKDYKDPKGYHGISYKGTLSDNKLCGKYEFVYKTMLFCMNICESFEMTKIDTSSCPLPSTPPTSSQ